MSEKSALDILVEETASAARKAVDEAKFDTSTYGVITEKAGTAYKVAAFGGVYRFTSSHEYSVGQKVVVTALQKNFRNIVVTEGNTNVELLNIRSVVGQLGNDLEKLSDKANSEQKEVQSQINNTITTYYRYKDPNEKGSNDPSVNWTTDEQKKAHDGDLYQNVRRNHCFRWADTGEGYEWVRITDSGLINALSMAIYARDTANSKSQTFTQKPTPMYNAGDIWTEGPSGDLYVCIKSRGDTESYSKDDWILATKYTDDTFAKEVNRTLNTQIDTETGHYNELSQGVSDNKTAIEKVKDSVEQIQGNVGSFTAWDYNKTKKQVGTNKTNIEALQTDLKTANSQIGTNKLNIETLQADLKTASDQVKTNKTNIGTLTTDLNNAKSTESDHYGELTQSISDTNNSVTALNEMVAAITLKNFLAELGMAVNKDGALCFVMKS
jgi:predicted  nucleic acid-binding Zn-ribbon protein